MLSCLHQPHHLLIMCFGLYSLSTLGLQHSKKLFLSCIPAANGRSQTASDGEVDQVEEDDDDDEEDASPAKRRKT